MGLTFALSLHGQLDRPAGPPRSLHEPMDRDDARLRLERDLGRVQQHPEDLAHLGQRGSGAPMAMPAAA